MHRGATSQSSGMTSAGEEFTFPTPVTRSVSKGEWRERMSLQGRMTWAVRSADGGLAGRDSRTLALAHAAGYWCVPANSSGGQRDPVACEEGDTNTKFQQSHTTSADSEFTFPTPVTRRVSKGKWRERMSLQGRVTWAVRSADGGLAGRDSRALALAHAAGYWSG